MALGLPSESTAVQQKSYVTFTCLPPNRTIQEDDVEEPTLTLLERRHLISGSLTTGFRTWEAALHLGYGILVGLLSQTILVPNNVLEGDATIILKKGFYVHVTPPDVQSYCTQTSRCFRTHSVHSKKFLPTGRLNFSCFLSPTTI